MEELTSKAAALLKRFKGDSYVHGIGALDKIGEMTAQLGRRAMLAGPVSEDWFAPTLKQAVHLLDAAGVEVLEPVRGAGPNAPREDVYRLHGHILHKKPDVVVALDSGSGIDACKAACVLATLGDVEAEIDPYFGVGQVTRICEQTGRTVLPVLAAMTAASSGAHLTKYSNVTDVVSGQKKLIVDDAIIPPRALFDYRLTQTQSTALTLDGGLDGFSHCLEVYLGAKGEDIADIEEVCLAGIELVISGLKLFSKDAADLAARELIALGTDLGGYAIMLGGTNGPHLNSFSLVKYLTHGRACAVMCPYYTVFFTPAVEDRVRKVGALYRKHGFLNSDPAGLSGRELGFVVAQGMLAFNRSIGFPTQLDQVEGIERRALDRALEAAKDPQLAMKLQNMPVPLTADLVDQYMGGVLEAAWSGDLQRVETR